MTWMTSPTRPQSLLTNRGNDAGEAPGGEEIAPAALHGPGGSVNSEKEKSREVRLGLVMYGGVSLAIYINGVAQELFRAVRGRGVYRLIKQLTDSDVVVDILSGTSAGGINGIMLAYALCNEVEFASSARLWRQHGDIDRLLRSTHAPLEEYRSLLDSEGYYQPRLEEAFADMAGAPIVPDGPAGEMAEDPSPLHELDLFITGTDFAGRISDTVDDRGQVVQVKDHRTLFWLKHREGRKQPFDPQAPLADLPSAAAASPHEPSAAGASPDGSTDPFRTHEALAKLARITSCFPAAFSPVTVEAGAAGADARLRSWGQLSGNRDRVFIDGGVLDNKPFTSTLDAIYHRTANRPVSRHLLFVEPDPERFDPNAPAVFPNPVRAAVDSLTRLPAYESIADDLRSLSAHNDQVSRFDMVASATSDLAGGQVFPPGGLGPASEIYRKARLTGLADSVFSELFETPPGDLPRETGARQRLRELRDWFQQSFVLPAGKGEDLLATFDVDLRLRRLLNLTYGDHAAEWDAHPGLLPAINNQIQTLEIIVSAMRSAVAAARDRLAGEDAATTWTAVSEAARRVLRAPPPPHYLLTDRELHAAVDRPRLPGGGGELLDAETRARFRLSIEAFVGSSGGSPTDLATGDGNLLVRADAFEAAVMVAAGGRVAHDYHGFGARDQVLYPLLVVSGIRERDVIHTVRVSPFDARSGLCDKSLAQKVAGVKVGHFGAFFKRSWRSNDILWGRLDGVCELVDVLVDEARLEALRAKGELDTICQRLSQRGDRYLPFLSDRKRAELFAALARMTDAGAVKRELPRVKQLLVEAAHYEILTEGLPDVIADAAYEQMKWNEFKGGPSRPEPVGIDAATLHFKAGTHAFDPAVVAVSSIELARRAVAELSTDRPPERLAELFRTSYAVGEETLDDIPRVVLLDELARALVVVRNCLLLVLAERADGVRNSALYRVFFDWPLRAFAFLARGLRRAPAGRGAFVLASLGYSIVSAFVVYKVAPHARELGASLDGALGWGACMFIVGPLALLAISLFLLSIHRGEKWLTVFVHGVVASAKVLGGAAILAVLVALGRSDPRRLCEAGVGALSPGAHPCDNRWLTLAMQVGTILVMLGAALAGGYSRAAAGLRSWLVRRQRR